jgi:FMN-dependent NADH-azoreductase
MTTLFRLDASIRTDGSTTRLLAGRAESAAAATSGVTATTRREIGIRPLESTAWANALAAASLPAESWDAGQRDAHALATTLADELEQADGYVFAAPLYNWGVSQHVKTWVDLVVTDPRFHPRTTTIAGRPAVLVVARGGDYRESSPQSEWDHATSWMRRIFGDVWGLDLRVVDVHLTLAPVRPYMEHLREDAARDLERALAAASAAGSELGRSLRAAA